MERSVNKVWLAPTSILFCRLETITVIYNNKIYMVVQYVVMRVDAARPYWETPVHDWH